MTHRPSHNFDGLDIEMARRIDDVCRRFEADWRQGREPRIEDYVGEVPDQGQPALRTELEALVHELRPSDETVVRPEAGPSNPDEAPTIAPGPQSKLPIPDTSSPAVDEE